MSFRRGLLALTGAGLLLRLAWIVLEPATAPVADETMWLGWGTRELPAVAFSPLRLRFIFHPPLYVYFIGVLQALFGSIEAVKYAQAVVGVLLVPAVGRIGRRAYGERAGLLAAAIAALYPELVWFVSHYWAETVFTVLLWWGLERTTAADERGSIAVAAAAGGLLGLATLTRETVLYFLPIAGLWLAWRRTGGAKRAAALVLAALALVVPWTIRNYVAFDAFVPVSASGALNLWQGNARMSREQVYEEYRSVHGRIAQYENARRKGIEAVLDRQPWWIFEKLRDEMPEYWAVHGQPVVHIERGAYGFVNRPIAYVAIGVVLLPYLAVLALFVAGIAYLPRERTSVLLLAFLAFYVLLHVASHGYPRYRLPSLPVLFLVAAQGVSAWRQRPRPAVDRPHALAAAAVGLTLALSVWPSLRTWAFEPWPPPWFAEETGTGTETPTEPAPGPGQAPEGR